MSDALSSKPQIVARAALPRNVQLWQLLRWALLLAFLAYLPFVLTHRAAFGFRLTNAELLNIGLTQINLMMIAMLGALSLNYLTGCAGLISIGHAAFYATGAMTAAIVGTQWGWPFPLAMAAAAVTGALVGVVAGPALAEGARALFRAVDACCASRRRLRLPRVPVPLFRCGRRALRGAAFWGTTS